MAQDAIKHLRRGGRGAVEPLVLALLDPSVEFAIRRRVPLILATCPDPRAVEGLTQGLEDRRFEVRYRCGRGLTHLTEIDPSLKVSPHAVYQAVHREVDTGAGVWEGRRLLDQFDDEGWSPMVDDLIRNRANKSLEHVFTLLALVLPREPLRIAFRGLHADDPFLRGTALEYLESALPVEVRKSLWPHLEDRRPSRVRPGRPTEEALDLVLLMLGSAGPALALGGNVRVRLITERKAVTPGRPFLVGLHMRIARGWHTYWRNPGDAGLPPRMTWNLPPGFVAGPIEWPTPERFLENTLASYGYSSEVTFPVEITPPSRIGADSVTIAGTLEWLECKDVCLPGSASLSLSLPVETGEAPRTPDAAILEKARGRLPAEPIGWSFSAESGPRAISLAFLPPGDRDVRRAYLFVDQPLVVDHTAPEGFERTNAGYRVTASRAPNAGNLARLTGVLVVEGGPRSAVRVEVPVSPGDPSPAPVPPEHEGMPFGFYTVALCILGVGAAILVRRVRSRKLTDA